MREGKKACKRVERAVMDQRNKRAKRSGRRRRRRSNRRNDGKWANAPRHGKSHALKLDTWAGELSEAFFFLQRCCCCPAGL